MAPLSGPAAFAPPAPAQAPEVTPTPADAADSPWLTDEQQRVWRQCLAAISGLPSVIGAQLQDESQLSSQDFTVLVRLSEAEGERLRMAALASQVDWDRSRLSHHVSRMERRGLVTREVCPEDGRGAFVALTDQGRERIRQAAPGHARLVKELVFEPLDEDDFRALDMLTQRLVTRMHTIAARYGS